LSSHNTSSKRHVSPLNRFEHTAPKSYVGPIALLAAKTDQRFTQGLRRASPFPRLSDTIQRGRGASDRWTGACHVVATGFGLHECDPVLSSLSLRVRVRFAPWTRSRISDDRCDGHVYIERERVRVTHCERVSRRTSTKQDSGSRTGFVCPDTRGARSGEGRLACAIAAHRCACVCADAIFQSASVEHSWPAACWKAQAGHMDQTQPDVHGVWCMVLGVQLRRFQGAGGNA
jgi:hypothetical protein